MTAGDLVTRYARSGSAHIAFQVIGEGPPLVLVPGLTSHLELQWEDAAYRSFVRRLARFATVIRYDKRGTGLSDPVSEVPSLDERAGDLAAVIDTAVTEKPVLFGYSEGGHIAVRFAATRGQALAGLVLYGTFAQCPPPTAMELLKPAIAAWGTGESLRLFAPSLAADPVALAARGRLERGSASPAMIGQIVAALALIDVRPLLPGIRVPTLVLHRVGELIPVDEARYMAGHLPGARLVELPGIDHIPWVGDSQSIVDEVELFVGSVAVTCSVASDATVRPRHQARRPVSGWASLTPREQAVAALVADGSSNPAIAARLFISRQTVETHVKHIFTKLGVQSRSGLAASARQRAGQGNT